MKHYYKVIDYCPEVNGYGQDVSNFLMKDNSSGEMITVEYETNDPRCLVGKTIKVSHMKPVLYQPIGLEIDDDD
jgi:hypothetical protein